MKMPWSKKTASLTGQAVSTGVQKHVEETSDYYEVIEGQGVNFQANAYLSCPPLQEVIGKRAQSLINGKLMPVDSEQDAIPNSAGFKAAMKVLNRPNVHQSFPDFLSTVSSYIDIFGVCFIYKGSSVGFEGVTSLIPIPNTCVTALYKGVADVLGNQPVVESYVVNLYGKTWTFRGEELSRIIEVRDRTVNLTNPLRAYSRIDGLKRPIQNLVASLDSRKQIIVRRGADVILSPKVSNDKGINATMLTKNETEDIQQVLRRYGLQSDQWDTAIFKIPMDATQITRNPKDLGLLDGENEDVRALLRAYNVPPIVFGMKDEAKYNTYAEGKSEFYEDGIIPHARIICECLDIIFGAEKQGFSFFLDYSHLQCMQRSEKDKAIALRNQVEALVKAIDAQMMTPEEARENLKDYLT